MTDQRAAKPSLSAKMHALKTVSAPRATELVRQFVFDENKNFLLVFETRAKLSVAVWIERNIAEIEAKLLRHGAVLLRGFEVKTAVEFGRATERFGAALPYRERSSPRTAVAGNVYTSTEYPPDQEIFFHNENSYAHRFPRRLYFFCETAPRSGGATPLSDVRRVLQLLPREIVEKFARKDVLYVRNFGGGVGLSWREVFQTESRAEVEKICAAGGYRFEWLADDRLRTRRLGRAMTEHPQTGEAVWFNHAAFFHVTTHAPEVRDALLHNFAPEDLPHNTFYGDGEPIEAEVLDVVRESYRRASAVFDWRENDLLIVDNILTAHARAPFAGARRILVAMSD